MEEFAHTLDDGTEEYKMTEGHTHRLWTVPYPFPWYVRALRTPLLHTRDQNRAERSPYPWGPCHKRPENGGACLGHCECWTLSTLSILHRWTGLTLYFEKPDHTEGSFDAGQRGDG